MLNLQDVGTREEHYMELLTLWQDTVALIEKNKYRTNKDKAALIDLEVGISLIKRAFLVTAGYNEHLIYQAVNAARVDDGLEECEVTCMSCNATTLCKSDGKTATCSKCGRTLMLFPKTTFKTY